MPDTPVKYTRLERIFTSASLVIGECSRETGIPFAWVRDLIFVPEELESNCSVQMTQAMATFCRVRPSAFFMDTVYQGTVVSEAELHAAIDATLEWKGISYEEFSDQIEWHLKDESGAWLPIGGWCIEQLQEACRRLDVEWLVVLEGAAA